MNANTTSSPFSGPRVAPDQMRAFGGVWRLTAGRFLSRGHLLANAGLLGLLILLSATEATPRDAGGYLEWIAGFYLKLAVPVLAFLSGAGAMRDETKPGVVDYVFTRPIRRWAFVIFKYFAHTACMVLTWLPAVAVLTFFAWQRGLASPGPTMAAVLFAQTLTIAGFSALGFFCSVLMTRYLIAGLLYAGVVEAGIGNIPAPLSRVSMLRQIGEMTGSLAPDGGAFAMASLAATTATMALFVVVFVGTAAVLFSLQEMTGARARD